MKLSTPILRLMAYHSLSRGLKLGPEDLLCLDFATRLRVATIESRLTAVWTHPANELATRGVAAAIARALGLITGTGDYLFLWENGSAALEAKAPKGSLTDNQKDFQTWCARERVPYFVFRSADEGEAILRGLGVLS